MQKLNFLVVDDAAFIRDLVKRTLKTQFTQCHIDEAINGKKAQSLLAKNRYDLVLCDWEMPEVSGIEVLQWLRKHEKDNESAKTPFMMVTSRGDKSHVVKAVEAGVSDYIGKPFSNDQLLKKVLKLLSIHHKDLVRAILKGTSAMQQAKAPTGNDSANVLMAAPMANAELKPPASESGGSASLLTGGSPSSKLVDKPQVASARAQKASLGKVNIRSARGSWQGDLRDINLTDASVLVDFQDSVPPTVLDQVVIDIVSKRDPENIARINTLVTAVVLQEKSIDCTRAHLSVRVVDDDAMKMEALSHFVAEVRR